jgi:hypothetical protein
MLILNQLGQSGWSDIVCDGSKQLFGYDASLLACAIAFGSVFVREAQIWQLTVHKSEDRGP